MQHPDATPNDSEQLFHQLAAEEPPVNQGDTSPSATAPRPAYRPEQTGWQRYLGGSILLAALLLTMAAGLIIFMGNEEPNDESNADDPVATTPLQIVRPSPTPSPVENTPAPILPPENIGGVRSTAAPDIEYISLLTPVPSSGNGGSAIGRDNQPFTFQVGSGERGFTSYVIQPGDTLGGIAKQFNLEDVCTIVWSNDRSKVSPPRVSAEIIIPPMDGVFAKVRDQITIRQLAEATQVDPTIIIDSPYNTQLLGATAESILVEGVSVLVPGGNGGDCNVWEPAPISSDGSAGGGVAGGGVADGGVWGCSTQISQTGFPSLNPVAGGYDFWQGFSAAHTGVDLAAPVGTTVVAAGAGTVIFAGWNNYGYGNVVVIGHGGSYSLYAHLSGDNVSCGQSVSAGQAIGTIGMSGRTSGPHLHFEIRDSGFQPMDPVYSITL